MPRRPLASAEQIARLAAEGWEIGAHTRSHLPLSGVTGADVDAEVVECRRELEAVAAAEVPSFAWRFP